MKTTYLTIVLLLMVFFIGNCNKDDSIITPKYLSGVVINKFTKQPVEGLEVTIEEFRGGIFGSNISLWDKTTTNSNGEFMLKLQQANPDYTYVVSTLIPNPYDTTKNTAQVLPGSMHFEANELNKKVVLELEPAGRITTYISDSTWNTLPADTVLVSSPYETDTLFRGEPRIYFHVDPGKLNQFSWHYLKNGINGNVISKKVYVGYSANVTFYGLKF